MQLPNIPKWMWFVIGIVVLLIILALLKVNFQIGSDGISLKQNLIR